MAIIECSKCGRRISDTVNTCIHCGAPTKAIEEPKEEMMEKSVVEESKIDKPMDYNKLSSEARVEYEKAFIGQNRAAHKYRKKGIEYKKILSLCGWSLLLGFLIFILIRYVCTTYFDSTLYRENLALVSAVCCIALVVFGIVIGAICLILRFIYKRSSKYYVYEKMFSDWLITEHNVKYYPSFSSEKEKRMYESVDLKIHKL